MHDELDVLRTSAAVAAKRLLGCELERTLDDAVVRLRIVETEAYDQTDAASHSYNGQTPRTDIVFGPAGHLYVYFTYGMHYCCNVVVGEAGYGAAVLVRSVEPLAGVDILKRNRHASGIELTNGPAKLCQALAIDRGLNGHDLRKAPLKLILREPLADTAITQTTRVGISRAKDVPWRFYVTDNPYVSRI